MKTLTVRLPTPRVAEIEAEARARRMSKSDVRERLRHAPRRADRSKGDLLAAIADPIGAVDGLPADLSRHTKRRLRRTWYGQHHPR